MKFLIPLVITLSLALGACSSSKKTEEGDDAAEETTTAEGGDASENGDEVASSDEVPAEESAEAKAEAKPSSDELPAEVEAPKTADAVPAAPPLAEVAEAPSAPAAASETPPAPEVPSTSASSSSAASSSGGTASYTVRSGDTLMKVAFEVYGDLYRWKEIYERNRDQISNPSALPRGLKLSYDAPETPFTLDRSGERYLIQSGDTLGSISGEVYGTRAKWRTLWERNKPMIKDPNRIYAGFYLFYEKLAGSPPPLANAEPAPRTPASAPAPVAAPPAPATASAPATPPTGG